MRTSYVTFRGQRFYDTITDHIGDPEWLVENVKFDWYRNTGYRPQVIELPLAAFYHVQVGEGVGNAAAGGGAGNFASVSTSTVTPIRPPLAIPDEMADIEPRTLAADHSFLTFYGGNGPPLAFTAGYNGSGLLLLTFPSPHGRLAGERVTVTTTDTLPGNIYPDSRYWVNTVPSPTTLTLNVGGVPVTWASAGAGSSIIPLTRLTKYPASWSPAVFASPPKRI